MTDNNESRKIAHILYLDGSRESLIFDYQSSGGKEGMIALHDAGQSPKVYISMSIIQRVDIHNLNCCVKCSCCSTEVVLNLCHCQSNKRKL